MISIQDHLLALYFWSLFLPAQHPSAAYQDRASWTNLPAMISIILMNKTDGYGKLYSDWLVAQILSTTLFLNDKVIFGTFEEKKRFEGCPQVTRCFDRRRPWDWTNQPFIARSAGSWSVFFFHHEMSMFIATNTSKCHLLLIQNSLYLKYVSINFPWPN